MDTDLLRLARRVNDLEASETGAKDVGAIAMWPRQSPPASWLLCDGAAVSRAAYSDLYAVIGTTYGAGDGSTTFNLPNLKGRVPVGYNGADTLFDALGEMGGAKTHTLTAAEMPNHTHAQYAHNHGQNAHNHAQYAHQHVSNINHVDGTLLSGAEYINIGLSAGTCRNRYMSGWTTAENQVSTATNREATATNQNTGGGGTHNNLQPYIVLNFIIRYRSDEAALRGARGDRGDKGDKGDKGDRGDSGVPGATGAVGPAGPQGSMGPRGEQGPKGDNAPQVLAQYSADAAVWMDAYTVGDAYMRLSFDGGLTYGAALLIRGEQGTQGEQGIQGEQGLRGLPGVDAPHVLAQYSPDGAGWHEEGVAEDAYMRLSTDGRESFGRTLTIKGPRGEKGDKGDDGEGVAPSGLVGQVLRKKTDADFDTEWGSGAGDVAGPSGTSDGDIALFDGPTGKLIRSAGKGIGDLADLGSAQLLHNKTLVAPVVATPPANIARMPGEITMWPAASPPTGWLLCDGASVSRTAYAALFAAVGTVYGAGDGSATFNLPNLKGRVPVGCNSADMSFDALGEMGGAKTHTLTAAEMPSHTHIQNSHNHTQNAHTHTQNEHSHGFRAVRDNETSSQGDLPKATNVQGNNNGWTGYKPAYDANSPVQGATASNQNTTATNNATTATNQSTGGGGAHNNMPPYLVLNYIIKT